MHRFWNRRKASFFVSQKCARFFEEIRRNFDEDSVNVVILAHALHKALLGQEVRSERLP
jgi:hypothetical protein